MKVLTLNEENFNTDCIKLYDQVLKKYQPDCIIAIANGGVFLAEQIKLKYDIEYFSVLLQRETTKNKSSRIGDLIFSFLLVMPYFVLNLLRNVEYYYLMNFSAAEANRKIVFDFDASLFENKKILIIDDAVDSGNTLRVFCDYVVSNFAIEDIKTAALVRTNIKSIVSPDYHLYENVLVRFPWAKDYKNEK